ncbi:MAG: hypothetical protein EA428_16205 [Spirochaetaceae bacterium]|nr:MAG: hypothetical protein EA428_16205 [Spirochaetaceae bacterium]
MAEGQQTSHERIGEFLVKIGAMTPEQLVEVLEQQKKEPNRLFGEIAVELGYINDSAVDTFLGRNKK